MVEQHYTPQQVAEILDVDDEQVISWIHAGELVAVNVAKNPLGKKPRWRVPESGLGKMLIARRHPASNQPAAPRVSKRPAVKQYV